MRGLGHGAAERHRLSRKVAAWILADGDVLSCLRRPRLGSALAAVDCSRGPVLAHAEVWNVGFRKRCWFLFRLDSKHVCWAVSLHAYPNSRRNINADDYPSHVVLPALAGPGRAAPTPLDEPSGCESWAWTAAEGIDRYRLCDGRRLRLSRSRRQAAFATNLESAAALLCLADHGSDRCTLARIGLSAQPALFQLHAV